jgi:hypothetical protein
MLVRSFSTTSGPALRAATLSVASTSGDATIVDSTVLITSALTSTVVSGLTTVVMKYYFDTRLVTFTARSSRIQQNVQRRNDALIEIGGQVYRIRNTARAFLRGDMTLEDSIKNFESEQKRLDELQFKYHVLLPSHVNSLIHGYFQSQGYPFRSAMMGAYQLAINSGIDPASQTIKDLQADQPSEALTRVTEDLTGMYDVIDAGYQTVSEKFNSIIWSRRPDEYSHRSYK